MITGSRTSVKYISSHTAPSPFGIPFGITASAKMSTGHFRTTVQEATLSGLYWSITLRSLVQFSWYFQTDFASVIGCELPNKRRRTISILAGRSWATFCIR